jgi:transposase
MTRTELIATRKALGMTQPEVARATGKSESTVTCYETGIALAKLREGAYVGRKHSLNAAQAKELRRRVAAGESKTLLVGEMGISRMSVYRYVAGAGAGK